MKPISFVVSLFLLAVLVMMLLLAGCITGLVNPRVMLRLEPNPLVVQIDPANIATQIIPVTVTATLTVSGVGLSRITSATVELFADGTLLYSYTEPIDIVIPGPVVPVTHVETLSYDVSAVVAVLMADNGSIRMTLSGDITVSDTLALQVDGVPLNVRAVAITDKGFIPDQTTVSLVAGTAIVFWINLDYLGGNVHTVAHTVPAGEVPLFVSPGLGLEGVFSYGFTSSGTYGYSCTIHPAETGVITVLP